MLGSLVKLVPAGITLKCVVSRVVSMAMGCCPLQACGGLHEGDSILLACRLDGAFSATWGACAGYLPEGGWEGCERAPWLFVTEISS